MDPLLYPVIVMVLAFVILLLLNTPIAVAIALSSVAALLSNANLDIDPGLVIAHKMVTGLDSFTLLAIPFFIISGMFMGKGGMARRLIDFSSALVGRLPGGLGMSMF